MKLSEEIRLSVAERRAGTDAPASPWPAIIRAWAKAVEELEEERQLFMRTASSLLDQLDREKEKR